MLQSSSGQNWRGTNKHFHIAIYYWITGDTGGQRSVRIAPTSLPPHHSSTATRDFQSSISVEALLWGCHLDVQGLFHQQLLSSTCCACHVPALWSPSWSDSDSPMHAPLQLTSPPPPSCRHLSPSVLSPVSVWCPWCRPSHSCRGYDIPLWIAYQEVTYPWPCSTLSRKSAWT